MRRTLSTALCAICLFTTLSVSGNPARYDISYLWHRNADAVHAYKARVGRVLGPKAAKQLMVVKKADLYGLIYLRRSDAASAARVARVHTSLLRSNGLDPAAPVQSWDWVVASRSNRPTAQAATTPKRAAPPQPKTAATRRVSTAKSSPPSARDLERAVEQYIKRQRALGLISSDERTGWSVYDFTTGEKLVTINEDVRFQAASLIKPFFALAFFIEERAGRLNYGPKTRRHMRRMIQHSNNGSTNWVLRRVGGPRAAERILKTHYPGIFRDTYIVEYIPKGGRTYRNKASVHDYSRFLYALWKDEIPGAREIRRLMALPGSDRIFTGAKDVPKGTGVYNKTGSTSRLCGDMGILVVKGRDGRRYPYTLVGVIEKDRRAKNYSSWIKSRGDVIRNVSNIVYKDMSRRYNL